MRQDRGSMGRQVLEGYGPREVAHVRIEGDQFRIAMVDAATAALPMCIYAFLVGDKIVRIGSPTAAASVLARRNHRRQPASCDLFTNCVACDGRHRQRALRLSIVVNGYVVSAIVAIGHDPELPPSGALCGSARGACDLSRGEDCQAPPQSTPASRGRAVRAL